jgi:hypothetical protein
VTLTGANTATPSFTAPTGPATLTFQLQVCDPSNACSTDSVTINVNAPGASTISIGDASATEGATETFTVTLSAPQPGTVTVDYTTADGTATAGSDYTAASGTVTFAPGITSQTVTVNTIDDNLVEGTETFNVNLSNPTGNATIADGTGVGTIIDNDVANLAPTAVAGGDQTVDSGVLVTLDGSGSTDPEGQPLTYMWTAPAGITLSDPTAAVTTFTAPTGPATLTFTLQVCDPEPLCSTDSVTINVNAPPVIDADGEVIVSGPTKAKAGSKTYTFKVTNNGTGPLTIDLGTALSGSVTVDGIVTGTVAGPTGTDTIRAGGSVRYKMVWTHDALGTGLPVVYSACVQVPGDIDGPAPECSSATGKPTS